MLIVVQELSAGWNEVQSRAGRGGAAATGSSRPGTFRPAAVSLQQAADPRGVGAGRTGWPRGRGLRGPGDV